MRAAVDGLAPKQFEDVPGQLAFTWPVQQLHVRQTATGFHCPILPLHVSFGLWAI